MENKSTCHMTNEKRLIDVNEELRKMQAVLDENPDKKDTVAYKSFQSVMEGLKKAPTVEAVEVVHAMWRWGYNSMNQYGAWCAECECGWEDKGTNDDFIRVQGLVIAHKYCPNCGAKMDGDGNG